MKFRRNNMKTGFFQYSVFQRDRGKNLEYIANALRGQSFDLLVLPELFTCGYSFDAVRPVAPFAEVLDDSPTVRTLQGLASSCGGVITGTIPENCSGLLYNTALLVGSSGLIGVQRKIHLPDYEKQFFAAGNKISAFDIGRAKIGMMSCFDSWFPAFGACLKQDGAQILCNSASFGGAVTPMILPIRALENQVFVVSCNRIGTEDFHGVPETFCGKSRIISPDGRILASAEGEEKRTFVEIDLDEIRHPAFGSLICKDFAAEHGKYKIRL